VLTRVSDQSGQFARTYGVTDDTVVIVRPDGYIGHVGTADVTTTDAAVIAGFVAR